MSEALTLERLFTSPAAFGVTTATPCQRALCRVADGLPLGDLARDEAVRGMLGDVDAAPVGERPKEVHFYGPIRSGKSQLGAALAVRASQSVDVSQTSVGDIVRISIVGLKLATNAIWTHLVQTVLARPALRKLLIGEPTSDLLVLRHPSGRPIEVMLIPLDKWGGSIISVYSGSVLVDEEPRMIGAEAGVKNWDDMHTGTLGRMLPGAQFVGVGAPWAPFGPAYSLVQTYWGRPSADMVVARATGPQMNPSWWTPKRMDDLRRTNPLAYRTDCLAEFADPESSLFAGDVIDRNTRREPLELPPNPFRDYSAAMDPATRRNAWTLVIRTSYRRREDGTVKDAIVLARQWVGVPGAPLSSDAVLGEIATICARYGIDCVRTDQWAVDPLRDIARRVGLTLIEEIITASRKFDLFENFRVRLEAGEVELPPVSAVRDDLLRVKKRVTQAGLTIELPKTSDGRHCDFAPAIVLALAYPLRPEETELEQRQRHKEEETNDWLMAGALDGTNAAGIFF
ncbi:MAG TPA: hypothetical protein VJT73_04855 [Polyangiaceae bacterium]|nr:hypothetical protein [Polyangiaceae bacterium]